MKARLDRLDDERLAALVGRGDAAAFEALYDRHHAALLAFCRHLAGSREDGEDALQQAFLRAHTALAAGRAPDRVRPWLFAIARNRCLTLIAARRDAALPSDALEPSFDGLADDVERRADLRELVTGLGQLPDDQRGALVLAELGDFSHPEIARVIGCSPAKVKALVFQARTTLIADRDARRTPCDEIRTLLETARGGVLRRGSLRRHLKQCDPCAAYRMAIEGRRSGLALILPVAPTAGLKAAVLAGAGGLGGGAETAAAAAALLAPGTLGAASGGGIAGGATAAVGGIAAKGLVAKAAVAVALAGGATGGGVAVHDLARDAPVRAVAVERSAERLPAGRPAAPAASPPAVPAENVSDTAAPAAPAANVPAAPVDPRTEPAGRRPLLRVARRLRAGDPALARRVRRRLRHADPAVALRIRRRLIRAHRRAQVESTLGALANPERRRRRAEPPPATPGPTAPERRRRRRAEPPATTPAATPEPAATAAPTTTPEPRPRARPRPRPRGPAPTPTPTPPPVVEPTPEPTAAPSETPATEPAATATPEP